MNHWIPKGFGSGVGPLPFPLPRLSAGRRVQSRLPYGAPKNGAVLTGPFSPQNKTLLIRGNGISLVWAAWLEASVGLRWSAAGGNASNRILKYILRFHLTQTGPLIEGAEWRRQRGVFEEFRGSGERITRLWSRRR